MKLFITSLIVFLNLSVATAETVAMSVTCSNENTYLKLNEVKPNKQGQRVGELYINFKDLNRILNIPEVLLRERPDGISVIEANSTSAVRLKFVDAVQEQDSASIAEVRMNIRLDGKRIRENIQLKCEK